MPIEVKADIEAVGALVIPSSDRDLFLAAMHTCSKEISGKLVNQISMLSETKNPGESDAEALSRMLDQEEVNIDGISYQPMNQRPLLASCLLQHRKGVSAVNIYLFQADMRAGMRIIDGEVERVGWLPQAMVLNAPQGSWWLRFGLYEAIEGYSQWLADPRSFQPRAYHTTRDFVPPQLFQYMDNGFSEKESLFQYGFDPKPLEEAQALIRLVAERAYPTIPSLSPATSQASPH